VDTHKAISVVGQYFPEGRIPSEYKGYIASFGSSIIQSGPLPAIAFYSDESSRSAREKKKVTMMIFDLLKRFNTQIAHEDFHVYVQECLESRGHEASQIKDDIITATIALKLAMRTFEFTENE